MSDWQQSQPPLQTLLATLSFELKFKKLLTWGLNPTINVAAKESA